MTKQEIINEIASELMYEDEFLEYAEAMDLAIRIYENMYGVDEDGI